MHDLGIAHPSIGSGVIEVRPQSVSHECGQRKTAHAFFGPGAKGDEVVGQLHIVASTEFGVHRGHGMTDAGAGRREGTDIESDTHGSHGGS